MSPLKFIAVSTLREDNKRLRAMLAAAETEIERLENIVKSCNPKQPAWTQGVDWSLTDQEIAETVGRSKAVVGRRRRTMGIPNRPSGVNSRKKTPVKSEENQKLLERIRARRKEQST